MSNLTRLDPSRVAINVAPDLAVISYLYLGNIYSPNQIQHLKFLRVPASVYGLGPIQAGRNDIRGALETRNVSANYYSDSGTPAGVLSSTQALTADQASEYKAAWLTNMESDSRVAVLGAGTTYVPLTNPTESQLVQARDFNTSEVSRLFGLPAGLLLVSTPGKADVYSNISQSHAELARFTLAKYANEIADAFSALLPRGTECRPNFDSMLAADTPTRFASYAIALSSGWMTRDEVRALEGLTALDEQIHEPTTEGAPE